MILQQSVVPWFPILDSFFHQLLGNVHKSFSKTIALWIVWAALDVVHLVELKELLELLRTVERSIVTSQQEWSAKFGKDHSEFFDHSMCGIVRKSLHNDEFGDVVTDHEEVNLVPVPKVCHRCGGTLLALPKGLAALELNWHVPHLSTALWMSSLIPDQNTDSWAFSIHFSTPWCPLHICCKAFLHSVEGMRIL